KLAFVRYLPGPCAPCYWEIDTLDLRSGATTKVTDGSSYEPTPTWSPDGKALAFTAYSPADNWQAFRVGLDGSDRRQLTDDWHWSSEPAWSPDGSQIAFVRGDDYQDHHIFVMNADGSNVRQLTYDVPHNGFLLDLRPAWSPDGTRIAFASDRSGSF